MRRKGLVKNNNEVDVWTEEQYEEYMKDLYDMDFIAGFTENGIPYGIFCEDDENDKIDIANIYPKISESNDLPF